MPSISASTAVLLSLFTLAATGQVTKDKPFRHARFLPVGDSPPFRQEIRGDTRYEIDPPADSVPPREVVPGFGKETTEAVQLHLSRISPPVKIPAGEGPVELRRKEDASPWVSIKCPESGGFLVYLFRNPSKQNWRDALSLVVPDGAPAGSLRIVNLCRFSVRINWGGELINLPAGHNLLKSASPERETPFQILVADGGGGLKTYYSGAVIQNSGERGLVTVYPADGESPRRPVKVLMLREPVPPAGPPDAKEKN